MVKTSHHHILYLKINIKWKGAGRSPANYGFGPLADFDMETSQAPPPEM